MNPIESNTEDLEESSEPLTKPKKPRSQKQMDAFQEALRKRAVNVELRKQEKLIKASEILVQKAKMEKPIPLPPATPRARAKSIVQESESGSDEEEIIIVKSKPKKKKKVKKIIIESSESDSDSGSSDGGSQTPQQKSYVKRHNFSVSEPQQERIFNSCNYFI